MSPCASSGVGGGSGRGAADSQYCPGASLNQLGRMSHECVCETERDGGSGRENSDSVWGRVVGHI